MKTFELLDFGSEQLRARDIKTNKLDAELLLSTVLKIKREKVLINLERKIKSNKINSFNNLLKRRCKNEVQVKRSLVLAEEDQAYAKVIKMLGNARLQADCYIKLSDGQFKMETKVCLIRGSMRKRVWINSGDVVLVSIREFDNSKGDVIHKYEPDEVSKLI